MKQFLKTQLKRVEQLATETEIDEQFFDNMRSIIRQTEMKATEEGYADVVRACQIRRGGIAPNLAREILSECMAAYQAQSEAEFITIDAVGEMTGLSPRTIRRRWYDKTFPPPVRFGRKIRWHKLDVENYRGKY